MKKVFVILVLLGFGLITESFGQDGVDATECRFISATNAVINGTNVYAVKVEYPSALTNWNLETSSEPSTKNRRPFVAGEVIKSTKSAYGALPKWKEFFIKPPAFGDMYFVVTSTMTLP